MSGAAYGGDVGEVSAQGAYDLLGGERDSVLVDVRTTVEWTFVGVPDLASVGKRPILKEWQSFPTMAVDPGFAASLRDAIMTAGGTADMAVLFLCRSGARSLAAARALAGQGFTRCLNVAGGFEGPPDAERHRGRLEGWKAGGLPWTQS